MPTKSMSTAVREFLEILASAILMVSAVATGNVAHAVVAGGIYIGLAISSSLRGA